MNEQEWNKLFEIPLFSMCGECPLVAFMKRRLTKTPYDAEALEAFKLLKKNSLPKPIDEDEEELVCTCDDTCDKPCKGGCGCERCSQAYGDFLSLE